MGNEGSAGQLADGRPNGMTLPEYVEALQTSLRAVTAERDAAEARASRYRVTLVFTCLELGDKAPRYLQDIPTVLRGDRVPIGYAGLPQIPFGPDEE